MNSHRYILEPYKGMNTRYRCPSPSCLQKDKTFSRYIDSETGEHIHPTVGRCNRESNCGYHCTPNQYFRDNNISFETSQTKAYKPKPVIPQSKAVSLIPVEVFIASLKGHETNHLVKFLINLFGVEVTSELISRYFIATSKHWNGATVFWQIDIQGRVRTGKIMLYNPTTGKRIKEPFNHITWAHKALKQSEFELRQCFFGEHLLKDTTKPVAIVESEKTAIIASIYLPQFIWLAVGSLTNLNNEKCKILNGRIVTLFPDLNGFDKWSDKAKEFSHIAIFSVSDLLERKASNAEREQGLDLADYLVKTDWREFMSEPIEEAKQSMAQQPSVATIIYEKGNSLQQMNQKPKEVQNWPVVELDQFFKSIPIPFETITLNVGVKVTNIQKFIDSHLEIVKAQNGKRVYRPYYERLEKLKSIISKN